MTASDWAAEPGALVLLVAAAVLYTAGCRRAARSGRRIGWRRPALFIIGWLVLGVAFISPLHAAGEVLVSAHMAQHALLVIAPLPLVVAGTGTRVLQALAPTLRGTLVRQGRSWHAPWMVWPFPFALMAGTILLWHVPPMFELATTWPTLHAAEHLSLVGVAFFYWGSIVGRGVRRGFEGQALMSIFALMVAGSVTGALLTFSTVPWYPGYVDRSAGVGVSWLADQQLAGVVMWVPMGAVLMGVAAWLAWRWSGSVGLRGATTSGPDPLAPP